ncbi:hypothetical protein [Anaeromyxobacter diazotrophicus]|uniref:Uncharacterized protein n=1 Tax=Anaeromyxobacter diazotrophicus TaxID=2590199 RepID=A0A7I9VJD6_9BACT|nr:hypothetical protein [Anaeromyxobacter diazotrophicus]GEJ56524.1 hypothetical protein AMYX_12650 [Anaeromyxobacter diazotrophicus]
MDELKVPKRRVPVSLTLAGGGAVRVGLFLTDAGPGRSGDERLGELLEEEGTFLPAVELESGAVAFISRAAVVVAEAAADADAEGAALDDLGFPTEVAVEITLVDGQRLCGHLSYVLPPERARPIDFLNGVGQFLPVHASDGAIIRFVHKRHVRRIDLLER